jgi:hypothetical protein
MNKTVQSVTMKSVKYGRRQYRRMVSGQIGELLTLGALKSEVYSVHCVPLSLVTLLAAEKSSPVVNLIPSSNITAT